EQGLIALNLLSYFLEPAGDGPLGNGLPHLGHDDVVSHGGPLLKEVRGAVSTTKPGVGSRIGTPYEAIEARRHGRQENGEPAQKLTVDLRFCNLRQMRNHLSEVTMSPLTTLPDPDLDFDIDVDISSLLDDVEDPVLIRDCW